MIQGSEEWFEARLGKVTASKISAVMSSARGGTGHGATYYTYMAEIVAQRLSGKGDEGGFTSGPMLRGIEMEPVARGVYEAREGVMVEECGLIDHPDIKGFAASPDGLVGKDGCIEIKCPDSKTHIKFLETEKIDKKYMWQMMGQMECAQREWCDFISFDDRLGEGLDYMCVRVERDEDMIAEMNEGVIELLHSVNVQVAGLEEIRDRNIDNNLVNEDE